MELRHLEAFLAVAEELHFGRAAEKLHVAQSPLSQTVRALERELGTDLFTRTTRSVQLTEAGTALLEPVRVIKAQLGVIHTVARSAKTGEIGSVRIGFGGASGYQALSRLARSIADAHPGIELALRPQLYSGEVVDALDDGTLDMGIVGLPAPPHLKTVTVSDEVLILAVPAGHRLAGASEVDPRDLAHERFVFYPAEHGSVVRDATITMCADADFAPSVAYEAPDPYSLLAMVGAGVGVAVVVASTQLLTMDGVQYLPLTGPARTLRIAMAWDPANPSPALAVAIDILRKSLSNKGISASLSPPLP
ncbi:LysR family transcriptional regulator [Rhodococcus sp. 06-156-3C]|uniref:LysR family transcriptional regulator n=1 Tax=Nocardiaceae TaxID=85025 RepID=UPI000522F5B7|nr:MULTISPECIES: LysR family transcriptional regulator [Rhodococcus]OZD17811.1 LysR family transcriptional regulator [Rhodococcus sp. 06-156-4C]OZD21387.1 LysR family transcriptional regulator [Rhodococcus sp. 06-156-4a]OZD24066.1 LysR family transcriptional regulator [Rhodococcus sp. 06-156-3b]OZD25239.1 LysR family transcriptional regulator [Rhodococcus sp. 06-156-3C]OZD40183.1 LysR family transcriptional regulator [Rhodococcus sp. 06-156-3]